MPGLLNRLLGYPYRISVQIYLGLGGAVALTFAASLVGWYSFSQVADAQDRVNESSIPELVAAFNVAQYSQKLVTAADALVVADTPEAVDRVSDDIASSHQSFKDSLAILESARGDSPHTRQVKAYSAALVGSAAGLRSSIWQNLLLQEKHAEKQEDLQRVAAELDESISQAMERQVSPVPTGPGTPERPLVELDSNVEAAVQYLASASVVAQPFAIRRLQEAFASSISDIERDLVHFRETPLHRELQPLFSQLIDLGVGTDNVLELRSTQLELRERQRTLLANNYDIALRLVEKVQLLVNDAEAQASDAADASERAILTGRYLLLAISLVSVGGAALIAWLFVGKVLLRRLALIVGWMRRLAAGDLDTPVNVGGRDEVAEMAAALEVFRRNAQEALRLNLVEEMAQQLETKNSQLEAVNGQLENRNHELDVALSRLTEAQHRIVAQEKLASLGRLTAGVAHEIGNPMNLIINLTELSLEAHEERSEMLANIQHNLTEDNHALFDELGDDLSQNLKRARENGVRVSELLQRMRSIGAAGQGAVPTDFNRALQTAVDAAVGTFQQEFPDFDCNVELCLDGSIGERRLALHDFSEAMRNLVTNGCYAMWTRSQAEEEGYRPQLQVSSRLVDDVIEVRVRDNGTGIDPASLDRIFDPFFTTRAGKLGAGLGLYIAADVARESGGELTVESQPGSYAEFLFTLQRHEASTASPRSAS